MTEEEYAALLDKRKGAKVTCKTSPEGSALEQSFALQLEVLGVPAPVRELRFAPPRKWRFDFAWPDIMLAVEIEGLTFHGKKGRHTTADGFTKDCEKYNAATLAGWRVLRFTGASVHDNTAAATTAALVDTETK